MYQLGYYEFDIVLENGIVKHRIIDQYFHRQLSNQNWLCVYHLQLSREAFVKNLNA